MLMRANIARPGRPSAIIGADLIADGNYQTGAVLMGPSSFIIGKATFPAPYIQGVFSFWLNYDSSASASGDSAKILNISGAPSNNSTFQTVCSFNPKPNSPSVAPVAISCVGIFMTPTGMDFYLRDGFTGIPLVGVTVPYVKGDTNPSALSFVKLGSFPSLVVTGGQTFDGTTWTLPASNTFIVSPCGGGLIYQHTGTNINTNPRPDGGSSWVQSLPDNPVLGQTALLLTGPIGIYDRFSVPADVYIATNSNTGGTPTSGWHHYIWSFDLGQTVTDVNGAQCFRVQCAIDRGGGPVQGGPIYDTIAQSVGSNSQPFLVTSEYASPTSGTLLETPKPPGDDVWVIKSPVDASCKWAYMYFGIPRNGFFDLNATRPQGGTNLDYFVTSGLNPQNLGYQGHNITPCAAQWMHTGGADLLTTANVPYFQINNAASPFIVEPVFNFDSVWTNVGFPLLTTPGPTLPPV